MTAITGDRDADQALASHLEPIEAPVFTELVKRERKAGFRCQFTNHAALACALSP
jgi:hypothetical protein